MFRSIYEEQPERIARLINLKRIVGGIQLPDNVSDSHRMLPREFRPKVVEYYLERHPTRAPQKLLDFMDTKGAEPAFKAYTLDFFLKKQ